jgi:hypothetical protein
MTSAPDLYQNIDYFLNKLDNGIDLCYKVEVRIKDSTYLFRQAVPLLHH